MDHVEILPERNAILSPTIILLFGILSNVASKEEDCHICLETITKKQFFVIELPCCGHQTHTECFRTWALTLQNHTKIRCAYCRTEYRYKDKCFLCLNKTEDEDLKCTTCCHSKVHSKCAQEIEDLFMLLIFEHTLECEQLTSCHCQWVYI